MNSKQKGNLTELQCITALIEQGCGVSIPYGDNEPYDLIADVGGKLFKIQVKTASKKSETSIKITCRSMHVNSSGAKSVRYSVKDVDYFATF